MSILTYYPNIPNAPDNPSYDQPLMQINSISNNSIWAVDHVTFNVANPSGTPGLPGQSSGQHAQVTFNSKNTPAGSPIDPVAILYTANGIASEVADMRFWNANAIFPVNLVRAYGTFTPGSGALNISQQINVNTGSSTYNSAGNYTIVLNTNVVSGTNIGVFITTVGNPTTLAGRLFTGYTLGVLGTFTILIVNANAVPVDPAQVSFSVMQL